MRHREKTIIRPGYHLKPKYDLVAFRKMREKHVKHAGAGDLPLVSLIDMFTILVLYLLMNFSATGEIFFIPKELKLPKAKNSVPIESAPLITVTAKEVIFNVEKVGDNPIELKESDENLPRLQQQLNIIKKQMEMEHPDQPFKGNINIQADESTPLIYIKRVMQTCIKEGWTGINFAVRGFEEDKSKKSKID